MEPGNPVCSFASDTEKITRCTYTCQVGEGKDFGCQTSVAASSHEHEQRRGNGDRDHHLPQLQATDQADPAGLRWSGVSGVWGGVVMLTGHSSSPVTTAP